MATVFFPASVLLGQNLRGRVAVGYAERSTRVGCVTESGWASQCVTPSLARLMILTTILGVSRNYHAAHISTTTIAKPGEHNFSFFGPFFLHTTIVQHELERKKSRYMYVPTTPRNLV